MTSFRLFLILRNNEVNILVTNKHFEYNCTNTDLKTKNFDHSYYILSKQKHEIAPARKSSWNNKHYINDNNDKQLRQYRYIHRLLSMGTLWIMEYGLR